MIHLLSDRQLTANFWLHEFACRCGVCEGVPRRIEPQVENLANHIQHGLRDAVGLPIRITSGWRCKQHNMDVGGKRASVHLLGNAADLEILGRPGQWTAGYVEAQIAHKRLPEGGVGTYAAHPHIIHYDTRGRRARWHNP